MVDTFAKNYQNPLAGIGNVATESLGQQSAFYSQYSTMAMSDSASVTPFENAMDMFVYGVPLGVGDFASTVASSVGLVDDDAYEKSLQQYAPDIARMYQRNKEGISLASQGLGAMIPGALAVKGIQATSRIGTVLSKIPNMSKLLVSTKRMSHLDRLMKMEAERRALSGIGGQALVQGERFKKMAFARRADAIVNGVKESVAAELAIYGTMNSSDLLYPEEMAWYDHAAWAGAGAFIGSGLNYVVARKAINDAARRSATLHHTALGQLDAPVDQIIVRPGNEDVAITMEMARVKFVEDKLNNMPEGVNPTLYSENLKKIREDSLIRVRGNRLEQNSGYINKLARRTTGPVAPGFTLNDAQKVNIESGLKQDATLMLGIKDMRQYEPDPALSTKLDNDRIEHVTKLQEQYDQLGKRVGIVPTGQATPRATKSHVSAAQRRQIMLDRNRLANEIKVWKGEMQPFVLRNGEWHPVENDFTLFTDTTPEKGITEISSQAGIKGYMIDATADPTTKQRISARIDFNLNYEGQKGQTLDNLSSRSLYEQSMVFALFDRALEGIKNARAHQKTGIIPVAKSDNWRRLDAIDEGIRRGVIKESELLFPKDLDLEGLRQKVVADKYKEYVRIQDNNKKLQNFSLVPGLKSKGQLNPAAVRYALNLPREQFGMASPLEEFFQSAYVSGMRDIDNVPLNKITAETAIMRSQPIGYGYMQPTLENLKADDYGALLRGNSMNFIKTPGKKEFAQPVIGWRMNMEPQKFNRQAVEEQMMMRRQETMSRMLGDFYEPSMDKVISADKSITSRLMNDITNSSAYEPAQYVEGLNQFSLRGNARVGTQMFAARDDVTLQAANDINALIERSANRESNKLYETLSTTNGKQHVENFQALRNKDNAASLFRFEEYVRARHNGWYVDKTPVKVGDEYFFTLDHTSKYNNDRFKALFGREIQKGDQLPRVTPDRTYVPLGLDEKAYQAAESFRQLGDVLLGEQNRVRNAMGLNYIRHKEWWVPSRIFSNKPKLYVVSFAEGDKIKSMITANTPAELQAKKESRELREYLEANNAEVFTEEQVIRRLGSPGFLAARDRAVFELLDANDHVIKGGKQSVGSSVDPFSSSGREVLDEAVMSINTQVHNLARDTAALAFESQISYAGRMRHVDTTDEKTRNVWDYYKDMLLGNRALQSDGLIKPAYMAFENGMDVALNALWDITNGRGVLGSAKEAGKQVLAKTTGIDLNAKEFEKLKNELGSWLPYENAQEFARSHFNVKPPTSSKELLAGLNHITSTVMLRFLEISHPILNFTGVVATMPAVISALKQRPTEAPAEWAGRIAGFGSIIKNPRGSVPFANGVRMMITGATHGMTKAGAKDWQYAVANGYLKQQVAELNETLVNPLKTESQIGKFVDKFMDWTTFAADKSEEFSRGWAHMAGLKLAEQHGIKTDLAKHTFAHRFANQVVGDYRSINKPVVFQGAAGMPLGLFQTYAWNYYQRVFSYIEAKDVKSAVVQAAMQGSIFGAVTIPGYQAFNALWNKVLSDDQTPIDRMQAALPPWASDLIMYGTLSSIPKIFGGEGIALYSRGDANARVPTFLAPWEAPVVQLGESVGNILSGVVDQVRSGGQGLSAYQTMEVIGTYINNRPLARMFEVASGHAVDRRGNVITNDTRNVERVISSIIGLRPLNEAKAIEVMQREKATELSQYGMRTRLLKSIKSAVRGENLDGEMLAGAIEDYVASGGDPRYFPRFFKTMLISAQTPKGQVALEKFLQSDTRIDSAIRLMNAGIRFDPDENTQLTDQQFTQGME